MTLGHSWRASRASVPVLMPSALAAYLAAIVMAVSGSQPVKLGMSICRLFEIRQQTFAADSRPSRRMKPLEHHTQNQTDADAEGIGFLIELHCVLEPVLHCCSS